MTRLFLCLFAIMLVSCDTSEGVQLLKDASKSKEVSAGMSTLVGNLQEVLSADNELSSTARESATYNLGEDISPVTKLELVVSPKGLQEQILRRFSYTVSYNRSTRCPNWVGWHLTASHTKGRYKRDGLAFVEDEDVPYPRATNDDYTRSGYERGHMCPSGDNKWSQTAQMQSFLYTNCCPQLHNLNAGDWNEIEGKCREWATKYGDLWIVCGPIYLNKAHKKIGKNKIVVPEAFFKVVLAKDKKGYKAIGFICRNEEGNKHISHYVNTVDDVERITGYDFFAALPDNVEKAVEARANYNSW